VTCKTDSTHHYACDCREEHFRKIEAENAELRRRNPEWTADMMKGLERAVIERDEAREGLQRLRKHVAHITKLFSELTGN
jgi:hypothetical protein